MMQRYEASLPISAANGFAKNSIMEVPMMPSTKNTASATRKIRSTCLRREEPAGVSEIIMVTAVGSPAVDTIYKVVNMLYAMLKYPIP